MKNDILTDIISAISDSLGANNAAVRASSSCLSADVSAAFDPMYADVYDTRNAAYINRGVVMNKYTGARGKSGTSDASAEFVGKIRGILDGAEIIANHGIDTVDLGVPVLSMHAPFEAVSKLDLYMTHLALCAFNS